MKDTGTCASVPDIRSATARSDGRALRPLTTPILDKRLLNDIYDAVMKSDKAAYRNLIVIAGKRGISPEDIADFYIPELSLQIGAEWCEDAVSFVEVTIAVAHLQAMLRDLGPAWAADHIADASAPLILLLPLPNAHHTLGCSLLAGQLRRRGYSVRLVLDPSQASLTQIMANQSFDAIFISASESDNLVNLGRMVHFLRTQTVKPLPIAVGGSLLDVEADIAPLVGVDIATSNLDEAVNHCGLSIAQKESALRAVRN